MLTGDGGGTATLRAATRTDRTDQADRTERPVGKTRLLPGSHVQMCLGTPETRCVGLCIDLRVDAMVVMVAMVVVVAVPPDSSNTEKRFWVPLLRQLAFRRECLQRTMWPFTRRKHQDKNDTAPCEATVIARKLKSNCSRVETSLKSCLRANRQHPERCDGLRQQLHHAQAGVLCPELAKMYEHCMMMEVNRASRTHDAVDTYACANVMNEIERCLSSSKNRKYIEREKQA